MGFFKHLVRQLIDLGNTVDIACNDTESAVDPLYTELGCRIHTIGCTRSPFHPGSITAIRQLRALVKLEQYDIVHCHTPVAAFCTRLACRKLPCKVFYTAHGFHFYKGAPLKNWLLFFGICSAISAVTSLAGGSIVAAIATGCTAAVEIIASTYNH